MHVFAGSIAILTDPKRRALFWARYNLNSFLFWCLYAESTMISWFVCCGWHGSSVLTVQLSVMELDVFGKTPGSFGSALGYGA